MDGARSPSPRDEVEMYLGDPGIFVTHHKAQSGEVGEGIRATGSDTFIVMAPPLFEELSRTRKVMVNLARMMTEQGVDVVRFDYQGTGLSDGHFASFDLQTARRNLELVLSYCRDAGAARIWLLGFRFGGYLALEHRSHVEGVLAWEPVLDLAQHFREMTRIELGNELVTYGKPKNSQADLVAQLEAQGSVLLDGFRVSQAVYTQFGQAPKLTFEKVQSPSVSLYFWDNQKLHEQAQKAGLDSHFVSSVRFSWRHIRFMEPRSDELFTATWARLSERGMHAQESGRALSV